MGINGITTQIMWTDIIITLAVIYALRTLTEVYIVKTYKKLNKAFFEGEWDGLEKKMIKHQNICNVFSDGPFNKDIRVLYNGLCVALASIGLMQGDEETFLRQLNYIKKEKEYEMKAFILSLYFCSKGNEEEAVIQYQKYLETNPKNKNAKNILEYLFGEKKEVPTSSVESFHNPAIIKLFKDNSII